MAEPCIILLMGVSGSGKTTVGGLLSRQLGWPYRDADSFHPPQNVAKMSAGHPLTDEDRAPWLAAIAAWIDQRIAAGESGIVSCSALRRRYRDVIAGSRPAVHLIHLVGEKALIARRMNARKDHFMPPALLDSQFATLETPGADERVVAVSVDAAPMRIVDTIRTRLGV